MEYSIGGATFAMLLLSAIIIGVSIAVGSMLKNDETDGRNLSFMTVLTTVFGGSLFMAVLSHLIYGR